MNLVEKFATLFALGVPNLARVGAYRFGLRLGLHPVLRIKADFPAGPFLASHPPSRANIRASDRWLTSSELFSHHHFPLKGKPDWHANSFLPGIRADSQRTWAQISDFDPDLGDIKTVWELSRFDWLVAMAQRAALGQESELDRLNYWLADWLRSNPPYRGVNWKCGQEASIRVMHLALAALILGQIKSPQAGMPQLIHLHLARIAPTIGYAIGQQNNHGTSEAAALFIGGSWLDALGDAQGKKWMQTGRLWLENRARKLIECDGTFSQYSIVYHRMMLDCYSLTEVWRRKMGLPAFSQRLHTHLKAAALWLQQMTDPGSGDTPNLGANDGARLIPLSNAGFRDFRPSLQLAATLFCNARALATEGDWDQPLRWLGIASTENILSPTKSTSLDDGGFHVLRQGRAVAYLRYPRFRFRPSQADALHLDLWHGGKNILRDAGTYSYNCSTEDFSYFSGTRGHNTVEFDGRDQMPRFGRFLFGAWLRPKNVKLVLAQGNNVTASAGYKDRWGARHHRKVILSPGAFTCVDQLNGSAQRAVLRWRLAPRKWHLDGVQVSSGSITLKVTSDHPIKRISLTTGYESRHYLEKTPLPVLEIETGVPATLTTEVSF